MIRKPTKDDFRESTAVTAVRETQKIAVEGSRGIGNGFSRALGYWLGFTMVLGLLTSIGGVFGPIGLLFLGGGAFFWWKHRKATAAARMEQLRRMPEAYLAPARPVQSEGIGDNVPFPAEVRREAQIELDIGKTSQQAALLFIPGLIIQFVSSSAIATIVGGLLVVLAVLVASRLFGDRTVLSWDTRTVTVHHIMGKGTAQWADVIDVSVVKSSRLNVWTLFMSGSRRNIVLRAPCNRLGGPAELMVPIGLLAMEQTQLDALLRDLFCWRAAGNTLGSAEAPPPQQLHEEYRPSPAADPRLSFDPDAIIARHLREREEIVRMNRPDLAQSGGLARPGLTPSNGRPVFGRKVV